MARRIRVTAVTHRGLAKARNEDTVLIGDWVSNAPAGVPIAIQAASGAEPVIVAVCDGLGGHAAGDRASQLAADRIRKYRDSFAAEAGARQVLTAIGAELAEVGTADPALRGMGTTVVLIAVSEGGALVASVGDSPIYEYSSGVLTQLIALDEVVRPDGQVVGTMLTQSLGPHGADIDVHVLHIDLEATLGPRVFLLCSDGLSDLVPIGTIEDLLADSPGPLEAAGFLLSAALAAGGRDNISLAIVRVDGAPYTTPPDRIAAGSEQSPYLIAEPR